VTEPVRVAGPQDAEVVAELLVAFNDHLGRDWPAAPAFLAGVRKLIERDDVEYLLAGDPPVGVAELRYRHGLWLDAEDCELEDLFVRAEAQGLGLGRALVEATIERARARGCRRIQLDTGEENVPAISLYESLGFRSGGGEPGRYGIFMRRRITENMPPGVE
jgi:ribosomal protein S18 acetylase RimI-like enzyme